MSDSCDPMGCRPPSSSIHGILQARTLEQVAVPFSRGSSRPRDQFNDPTTNPGSTGSSWSRVTIPSGPFCLPQSLSPDSDHTLPGRGFCPLRAPWALAYPAVELASNSPVMPKSGPWACTPHPPGAGTWVTCALGIHPRPAPCEPLDTGTHR